jgi:type III secretion protein N (ATPase)
MLVERNDMTEPIANETRFILDGHFISSAKLAAMKYYLAADIFLSVSHVFNQLTDERHRKVASKLMTILSKHQIIKPLVRIGEHQRGVEKVTEEAIDKIEAVTNL